jgi:co-chaperonin GroES (HSP10)
MSMAKNEIVNFGKIADIALADVPALEECHSGLNPLEYNLIVIPAQPPKAAGKQGLILLADETKERMGLAAQIGRIVAISPVAFDYAVWPDEASKPKVGDIIWFARYAGGLFEGADGKEYRIIKDKDVSAIVDLLPSQAKSLPWKPTNAVA